VCRLKLQPPLPSGTNTMSRYLLFFAATLVCIRCAQSDDSRTVDLQLTLPPTIYATTGIPTGIYFDNIILSETPADYRFDAVCDVGVLERSRWTWTPGVDNVGSFLLTVKVLSREGTLLDSKSTTIQVVPADSGGTNRLARLLIIGDSLTHASAYPNEVVRLLSQPGNPEVQLLGTHRPTNAADGVRHEGYGGWTWARFVNHYEAHPDGTHRKRSSPFVFLDKNTEPRLDVQQYFDTHCDGVPPDYVTIMLGINDCFGAPPDNAAGIDAQIDTVFGYADQLLNALQQAAPEAHIGLCLTTPPNSRQAAFEANYEDKYTRWGWKRIQHRLVQRQIAWVQSKKDSRISIIPTQLNLNPVGGYPENNGVHPNDVGYRQIGATVYSWLKNQLAQEPHATVNPTGNEIFVLPYFLGNGETGIYFAFSRDGLHFEWLNKGNVLMPAPNWEEESLTRDPSIIFRDGVFHMVWTTSWKSRSIGYASSTDLKTWTQPQRINIWHDRTDVTNTWAPELHWDPEENEYIVIWSSTTLKELNDGDGSADGHGHDHRTYAARTTDFIDWTKPVLFFSPEPEYSVIDPFLAHDDRNTSDTSDDRWVMVIKNEMASEQGGKNLRLTFSQSMQGPYDLTLGPPIVGAGTDIVDEMGEGPSLIKRDSTWFLYWDAPNGPFSYCLATSPDLTTWTNRSADMSLPAKQMRHGTVLVVPESVLQEVLPGKQITP
jgi:lysophospholipase L1-like esterase